MRAIGYQRSLPVTDPAALLDIELPTPVAGGHDLLVRVEAVSVNPVDTKFRRRSEPAPGEFQVLGWDVDAADGLFTGSFTDMDLARSTAESLFQESCDIIIPVGGAINLPAGDVINDTGLNAALVGVDADAYFAMPEQYQPLWLTTVEKAIGPLVALSVQQQAEGTWTEGAFIGNLGNDGVGLSAYHDWEDRVSADLQAEVEQLLQDIKDGAIKADYITVGY